MAILADSLTPFPLVIFVVGPTASGKSAFAVQLAEALAEPLGFLPEIINGDSIQFFQAVEIGAAKPELELMARVPHHLVSCVPAGESFTAGDFRRAALAVVEQSVSRGHRVLICVGGSGFYLQAFEKGMYPVPEVAMEIRASVEHDLKMRGLPAMFEELQLLDPQTAHGIQPQDRYRISRSLEVLRASTTGETLSEMKRRFENDRPPAEFQVLKIGVERARVDLRARVETRTRLMLAQGLVDEVKALRLQGLKDWPPLQSVGYHEVQEYLDGRLAPELLEPQISTSTMQLAKRQMTWFRRDQKTLWVDPQTPQAFDRAVAHLLSEIAELSSESAPLT